MEGSKDRKSSNPESYRAFDEKSYFRLNNWVKSQRELAAGTSAQEVIESLGGEDSLEDALGPCFRVIFYDSLNGSTPQKPEN